MRIARITRAFIPERDGVSNHTYYLSKYQAELDHEVMVFQPHLGSSNMSGFEVVQIGLGPLRKRYGSNSVTALFVAEAFCHLLLSHRARPFDILHVHGDIVEIAISAAMARLLRVPLVVTAHGRLSRSRSYAAIARRLWPRVDGAIVVSPEIGEQLTELGVNTDRIAVITSGVETERFRTVADAQRPAVRKTLGLNEGDVAIAAIGRLSEVKGFEYLIRAVQSLRRDTRVVLYIVGDGPLKTRLESLAAGDARVRFTGGLRHDKVPELLGAADIFALSSVDLPGQAEGTPTAVMEAMACELPVITTDSGGARHVIENRPGLTVVAQRSPADLARSIELLSSAPDFRRELGRANRKLVAEHDWSVVSRRVVDVYTKARSVHHAYES